MLFSHLARIAAWLVLIYGVVSIVAGFGFATWGPQESFLHYFPGRSTGQMVDQGIYWTLVGIAFGTVAEISFAIRRMTKEADASVEPRL
jgi:hypothetical protein